MVTLLLKNRSPLNPADNEGYTPLHHAIAEGHGKKTLFATDIKKPLTPAL
jgi:ankyrin repeat protein